MNFKPEYIKNNIVYLKNVCYYNANPLIFEHSFIEDRIKVSEKKNNKYERIAMLLNDTFKHYRTTSISKIENEKEQHAAYWVKKLPKDVYEDLTKEIQHEGFRQI